ncbi:uncharacterized protein LOC129218885 [Uloborus diversus]|uniref:uncharacterized protein LOC129218885 n=1 Tax=Uloborus diversus TaxID=327109 RepID=UPI00240A1901|nr:uncharacterized protein LOC129218885 [Uloborus diversus]
MKYFCVLLFNFLTFSAYAADDRKTKSLEFYTCISCAEDKAVRDEYDQCEKLLPQSCQEWTQKCVDESIPEAKSPEEQWSALCKQPEKREQVYDCIMDESRDVKDLSEEDLKHFKDFMTCAKKLKEKYCKSN